MRTDIEPLLRRAGGVTTRARLLTVLSRNELDHEIRRGHLTAIFPRVYGRPWVADDPTVLDRAALTSVGQPAVLSHLTAVRRWGVDVAADVVHVTVPSRRHPRSVPGRLAVHRLAGRFPPCVRIDGLPTVALADALVGSFAMLDPGGRRRPVIDAVRRRLTTHEDLRRAAARSVAGRQELLSLIDLLAAGCESELEIFGLLHVFDHPRLRHAVRQKSMRVGGQVYRLDLAFEDERVAVELDGWTTHGTREARERDLRRDAALASIGWITIRFTYARLMNDAEGCRRDLLAALTARRQAA